MKKILTLLFLFSPTLFLLSQTCPNRSLDFDGTGDYVQSATAPVSGNANFTLEARFICTSAGTAFRRLLAFGGSSTRVEIGEVNGRLAYYHLSSAGTYGPVLVNSTSLRDGNWHHLALVRNGSNMLVYLDCALANTYSLGNGVLNISSSGSATGPAAIPPFPGGTALLMKYAYGAQYAQRRISKAVAVADSTATNPGSPCSTTLIRLESTPVAIMPVKLPYRMKPPTTTTVRSSPSPLTEARPTGCAGIRIFHPATTVRRISAGRKTTAEQCSSPTLHKTYPEHRRLTIPGISAMGLTAHKPTQATPILFRGPTPYASPSARQPAYSARFVRR